MLGPKTVNYYNNGTSTVVFIPSGPGPGPGPGSGSGTGKAFLSITGPVL